MSSPNPRVYVNQSKPGGWFSVEDYLNELNVFMLASNTAKVLATGIVDINGELLTTFPITGPVTTVTGKLVDENGVTRTVNRAFVNAANSGNTELVAAQGGSLRIRVLSLTIVTLLAVNIKFQSATTDVFCTMPFGATGGVAIPYNPNGLFQTSANEALSINLSAGVMTVGCNVTWCQAT